jgi:hypothetical protein
MVAGKKLHPLVLLLLLATVVPELFTGSTPLTGFFNPFLLLILLIGYGLAVVLLREIAVRCGTGLGGMIVMGFGYGIYNEGFLAKTVVLSVGLPVGQYDHYGILWGISFPFMAAISFWHAFASFIFPVLLTHHLVPERSREPWLKPKGTFGLAAFLILFGVVNFLGTSRTGVKGTFGQLLLLLALLGGLVGGGAMWKGTLSEVTPGRKFVWVATGFSVLLPFWELALAAAFKWPVPVFFLLMALVLPVYAWLLRRLGGVGVPALLYFGLGWYLHNMLQALLFRGLAAGQWVVALLTTAAAVAIWTALYRRIGLRPAPGPVPSPER